MAVVVLNTVVGFVQEFEAEQALRTLAQMIVARATVVRDGEGREIDSRRLVSGDAVLCESGVGAPADLRLFRAIDLQAVESTLTGESGPVTKATEPLPDPNLPIGDRINMDFMGASVVRGRGSGLGVETGTHTVASIAVALGLHVLALYCAPLKYALRLEPRVADDRAVMADVAASVLVLVELEKATRRRSAARMGRR